MRRSFPSMGAFLGHDEFGIEERRVSGRGGSSELSDEPLIAVFVDYENLAIGARDSKWKHLNIDLILKRLLEKGRIVYRLAYCDGS